MKTSADQFAIIVLHYGEITRTKLCLNSLQEAFHAGARIIIPCNCSRSESREVFAVAQEIFGADVGFCKIEESAQFDSVSETKCLVIANNKNLGYAAGNNKGGFTALLDGRIKWLWFLNNDTVVEKGSFASLLEAAKQSGDKKIIGATVVDMDNPERVQCAGGNLYNPYLTTTRAYCGGMKRHDLPEKLEVKLDYVFGASICIPAEIFKKVSGFCEEYFLYYEEIDFCRRAALFGCFPSWASKVIVRHERGGATGDLGRDYAKRDFAHYHENYSTFIFTFRHHKKIIPLVLALRIAGKLPLLAARGEGYLVKSLYRAVRDFFKNYLL